MSSRTMEYLNNGKLHFHWTGSHNTPLLGYKNSYFNIHRFEYEWCEKYFATLEDRKDFTDEGFDKYLIDHMEDIYRYLDAEIYKSCEEIFEAVNAKGKITQYNKNLPIWKVHTEGMRLLNAHITVQFLGNALTISYTYGNEKDLETIRLQFARIFYELKEIIKEARIYINGNTYFMEINHSRSTEKRRIW